MKTIECVQEVLNSGASLIRRRKENILDTDGKAIPDYDLKPAFSGKKRGWFYLDHFTASAIMACYNALNEMNKSKANRITITTWADLAFKYTK